jgi:hypothetical protein
VDLLVSGMSTSDDLQAKFDEAIEDRDTQGVFDVARQALKQLAVTQSSLDNFISATANETIRAMLAESKLVTLQNSLRDIIKNNPNREESDLVDACGVLEDLYELIGTF